MLSEKTVTERLAEIEKLEDEEIKSLVKE